MKHEDKSDRSINFGKRTQVGSVDAKGNVNFGDGAGIQSENSPAGGGKKPFWDTIGGGYIVWGIFAVIFVVIATFGPMLATKLSGPAPTPTASPTSLALPTNAGGLPTIKK